VIYGAHVILYSRDADADRAFLGEVLGFDSVDAGHGWLIFELPPAEAAVHPSDDGVPHELFLMTDDLESDMANLAAKGVTCGETEQARWGTFTHFRLPGGSEVGLYQPSHPSPIAPPR
jgi:catechol 2,3-dioxygenase-like lactoylglutathione lyase family enzyme